MENPDFENEVQDALHADPELQHVETMLRLAAWHSAKGAQTMAEMYLRSIAHHTRSIVKHRFALPREKESQGA